MISHVEERVEKTSNYSDKVLETVKTANDGIHELWRSAKETKDTAENELGSLKEAADDIDRSTLKAAEGIQRFNDISSDSCEGINNLSDAFSALGEAIRSVSSSLGLGEDAPIGGLADALKAVNGISLDDEGSGIISQFNNLKGAVDGVASAISGSSGGAAGNISGSPENEGDMGSLISAIGQLKEKADETLGSGGDEGSPDGSGEGVIGKFHVLKDAVDAVTAAIASGEEGGESPGEGLNLTNALQAQFEKAEELLPQEKSLFEDLLISIEACVNALNSMKSAMDGASGLSVPAYAEGTVGKAFAKGYDGLPHAEKNALVSEYGQLEMTVLPDGKVILTDTPTMMDLPKDTVIYNEAQTRKIMGNKVDVSGHAHAGGTAGGAVVLKDGTVLRPLQPEDPIYDMIQKFDHYLKSIDGNLDKLTPGSFYEHNTQMNGMESHVNYTNSVMDNKREQVIHQEFNVALPNVTNAISAESLLRDLESIGRKKFQVNW